MSSPNTAWTQNAALDAQLKTYNDSTITYSSSTVRYNSYDSTTQNPDKSQAESWSTSVSPQKTAWTVAPNAAKTSWSSPE